MANSRHPQLVGTRHRLPFDEGPRSQHTMMGRPQQMSAHPEEILPHAVDRREALQLDGRLEAPHLALMLSRRLMRHLGAVVRILIRDVNDRRHHGPRGRRVAPQFIGDQPAGYAALAFQKLPEKAHCGAPVPPRLHQDVEDVAVLVYRPPQVLLTTVQRDEQLIEVPRVPEAPTPVPEPSGIRAAERATPPSDRLVGTVMPRWARRSSVSRKLRQNRWYSQTA